MQNGRHASTNGHNNAHPHPLATSPAAPMTKSVKLVLKPKNAASKQRSVHQDDHLLSSDALANIPLELLERELPPRTAFADQVPLADIIDRLVQDAYSKLVELSDTLPGTSLQDRPKDIDHYANETRKKFMKAYVLSKWAKSAVDVETSMAIYAYLDEHGSQIDQAVQQLSDINGIFAGARLRNPDLVTAVALLTQEPSTQKSILPTMLRDQWMVKKPMSAAEIRDTFVSMNDVLRTRLRLWELVPLELSEYTIDNGRVYFTATGLFTASFSLTGPEATDKWYIVDLEFLVGIGSAAKERFLSIFPRKPPPNLWQQLVPGINYELAKNVDALALETQQDATSDAAMHGAQPSLLPASIPALKPTAAVDLSVEIVDAPLVRAFNLLQMLSLSYQLEILTYQLHTLRSLGWSDHLDVATSPDRQSISLRYWIRTPPPHPPRTAAARNLPPLPLQGGKLTISIVSSQSSSNASSQSPSHLALPPSSSRFPTVTSTNPHVQKLAQKLDQRFTLEAIKRNRRKGSSNLKDEMEIEQSDSVEQVSLEALWEPTAFSLSVNLPEELLSTESRHINIDSGALDFEGIIKAATRRHARLLLAYWQAQILSMWRKFVTSPDGAILIEEDDTPCLKLSLFQDLTLFISIDLRTGKLILRDSGDLTAWERGYRFARYAKSLNETPHFILDIIQALRFGTIIESVELQVNYIGLHSYRHLLPPPELRKFGEALGHLFVNITTFPAYYLVIVATLDGFKYALINTARDATERQNRLVMKDVGWIDIERLGLGPIPNDFAIRPHLLREMYAFACARVSHTKLEEQLKSRGIPYASIFPSSNPSPLTGERNRAVPVLRILARDLWPNTAEGANEGACQNVKVSLMNWWNSKPPQIVTEVKLRHPPSLSLTSSRSQNQAVSGPGLRNNSLVSYDPKTSIVSFLSCDVDVAVDELQGEWDRVQKTLAIARHVSDMARQKGFEDVRLLSFNLLTIEFTYLTDFFVTIEYIPSVLLLQPGLPPKGTFQASFSRLPSSNQSKLSKIKIRETNETLLFNPHQEVASYLAPRLIEGTEDQTRQAVQEFVLLLRSTLPVLLELDSIRADAALARRKNLSRPKVSIIYKSGAWFRIIYGELHALDIRVLANYQVALVDANSTMFQVSSVAKDTSSLFTPIPNLAKHVDSVVLALQHETLPPRQPHPRTPPTTIFTIGNGLRCTDDVAKLAMRRLHETILEALTDQP